jgi:phosphoribosylaminoimidazole (AIR) synthetase
VTDGVGGKDDCPSHSNRVEEVGSDVLLAMFPAFISRAGAKRRVKVGARPSRQR